MRLPTKRFIGNLTETWSNVIKNVGVISNNNLKANLEIFCINLYNQILLNLLYTKQEKAADYEKQCQEILGWS